MAKIVVAVMAMAVGVFLYGLPAVPDVDSAAYQLMAEGRMDAVVRPYANRVLHPLTVRLTGGSFGAVAVATLAVTLGALAGLFSGRGGGTGKKVIGVFACLVCAPFFCSYATEIYLSDLFVVGLTALFFLGLHQERWIWAVAMLFLMQMARESTVVIAAVAVMVALLRRNWRLAAGMAGAVVCGMVAVGVLSRESPGNIHTMGGVAYMVAKVVANGLANLFGVTVWSDTYARALPGYYPMPPLWQMAVPSWWPFGSMKALGVYAVDGWRPVETLAVLVSAFGVLPVVLGRLLLERGGAAGLKAAWRRGWAWLKEGWFAVVVAFLAGTLFFLLSPFSGRSLLRLVGYAWPLFWFALPQLSGMGGLCQKRVLVLHVVCMWWPVLLVRWQAPREMACVAGLLGALVCLVLAARWGRGAAMREAVPEG